MIAAPYVDTSALAKWYINERRSADFEAFARSCRLLAISRLVTVELRCLIARRTRSKELNSESARRVVAEFERDIQNSNIEVHSLEDRDALTAIDVLAKLQRHPLRALDALHLGIAVRLGAAVLATADSVMADAAKTLGLRVERFD